MRFVIITGMSGAGKSQAVNILEDAGYYCTDNMPPSLISKFAELCASSRSRLERVALVCDIRSGEMFGQLSHSVQELKNNGYAFEILFLEADDDTLVKRYKESRRKHPLSENDRIPEAIAKERAMLADIKNAATHIIDTSGKSRQSFRNDILQIFCESDKNGSLTVNVLSFGYKYGAPLDADLLFDVRFLPNPFYIPSLKEKSGLDDEVADYVMSFPQSLTFQEKLWDMIDFLLPHYAEEGKPQVVVGIGCTGGKHRSVTFARLLSKHLESGGYRVYTTHRDYNGG